MKCLAGTVQVVEIRAVELKCEMSIPDAGSLESKSSVIAVGGPLVVVVADGQFSLVNPVVILSDILAALCKSAAKEEAKGNRKEEVFHRGMF